MFSLRRIGTIVHSTVNDELHHKSLYFLGHPTFKWVPPIYGIS